MRRFPLGIIGFLAVALGGGPALGHQNHVHKDQPAAAVEASAPAEALEQEDTPFLFDLGGDFALTDHHGQRVGPEDYRGQHMLIFFGYAQCESICPVGLKTMVEAVDLLGESGEQVQPLLITVDPENDTVEALAKAMPKVHPRLVGLTGSEAELAAARKAYKVESKAVGEAWDGKPVYSHGSFIYLMKPDGSLGTILPPVLGSEAMAKIMKKYL